MLLGVVEAGGILGLKALLGFAVVLAGVLLCLVVGLEFMELGRWGLVAQVGFVGGAVLLALLLLGLPIAIEACRCGQWLF